MYAHAYSLLYCLSYVSAYSTFQQLDHSLQQEILWKSISQSVMSCEAITSEKLLTHIFSNYLSPLGNRLSYMNELYRPHSAAANKSK